MVNNVKEGQVIANGLCPTDQEGKLNKLWMESYFKKF